MSQLERRGLQELGRIVAWYFERAYRRWEGPGVVPFFCDPGRVGHFAVDARALLARDETALFRLFVGVSMYQARRDVVIMSQQRGMRKGDVAALASLSTVRRRLRATGCGHLEDASAFGQRCDVYKGAVEVDCSSRPGLECPTKTATRLLRRTGEMGMLPVSAALHLRGGFASLVAEVTAATASPTARAEMLVTRLSAISRVGRKLATLFVGILTTPSLYPGCEGWWPGVEGHELVVIDTHVGRFVDMLRGSAARTYDARASWLTRAAQKIDLSRFSSDAPPCAPRLVQQALYVFGSRSNRIASGDRCAESSCGACPSSSCPLSAASPATRVRRVGQA